jgi:hypothetical protein
MKARRASGREEAKGGFFSEMLESQHILLGVVASLALSALSWYNTWDGMSLFFPFPINAIGTLGIQLVVIILAWLIAYELLQRRLASSLAYLVAYIVAAGVSIVFAYSSLYEWVAPRETRAEINARAARNFSDKGFIEIARALEAVVESAHREITQSKAYGDWTAGANRVIFEAQQSSEAIKQAIQRKAQKEKEKLDASQVRYVVAQSNLEKANARAKKAQADIARLDGEIKQVRASYDKARGEAEELALSRNKLRQELEREERKGGSRQASPGGKGPIWRGLKAELEGLEPRLYQKELERDTQAHLLQGRERDLGAARADAERAAKDLSDSRNTIAFEEPLVKAANEALRVYAAGSGVAEIAGKFKDALARFDRQRDLKAFTEAGRSCEALLAELRKEESGGGRETLRCDSTAVLASLTNLEIATKRRDNFESLCRQPAEERTSRASFMEVFEFVRQCTAEADVKGEAPVQRLLQRFADEQTWRGEGGGDQEHQKGARVAIYLRALGDGSPQAYAALGWAVILDALILLVAIASLTMQARAAGRAGDGGNWRDPPLDSEEGAAIKRILSKIVVENDREETPLDLDAAGLRGDDTVQLVLNKLVAADQARQEKTETGRTICYVTPAGYTTLFGRYRTLQSRQASGLQGALLPSSRLRAVKPNSQDATDSTQPPRRSRSFLEPRS